MKHKFQKTVNLESVKSADELIVAEVNNGRTLGDAIYRHINELNSIRTKDALISFVESIQDEVSDPRYFKKILNSLYDMTFINGYKMIYDIYLKSTGLSISY